MNPKATVKPPNTRNGRTIRLKWSRLFINSAGGILLAAAIARFLITAGSAQVLTAPDLLLGIPLRHALLVVGAMEFGVALVCLFGKQVGLQSGLLAWLATNFIVYRIGLFSMDCQPQATCIGSLTDPLHLAHGTTGFIIGLMPYYLLLGSYATMIWLGLGRKEYRNPQPVAVKPGRIERSQEAFVRSLKIACTACGGHIEFPTNFFGERIPCPHCQASIILQKSAIFKMSCLACDGHIAFPAHAIGEIISCPHCNLDITLQEPIYPCRRLI
ncbi:MAG TPA: hypothetical protein VNN22_06795 [Verrucomicrobiae bacterium]|nr:hypothetical protein [Verrucomicrobiae bacterium]